MATSGISPTASDRDTTGADNRRPPGVSPGNLGVAILVLGLMFAVNHSAAAGNWGEWQVTDFPASLSTEAFVYDIARGDHRFVAVGCEDYDENGFVLTSHDGTQWTMVHGIAGFCPEAVAWNGTSFLAAGPRSDKSNRYFISADGVHWSERELSVDGQPDTHYTLYDIRIVNGSFYGLGSSGGLGSVGATIIFSTDGLSWSAMGDKAAPGPDPGGKSPSEYAEGYTVLAMGNGRLVAVGYYSACVEAGAIVAVSNDGISWSRVETNLPTEDFISIYDLVWGNGLFVAVGHQHGSQGAIYTSPDGIEWTAREPGTTALLGNLVWDGARFVAIAENGTVLTSSDGVIWENQGVTEIDRYTGRLATVVWTGSQFLAAGIQGFFTIDNVPPIAARPEFLYQVPAVASSAGLETTTWLSDLVLFNAADRQARANLYLMASGHDNSAAKGKRVTVPAGSSLRLSDVVQGLFATTGTGALIVSADTPLLVSSQTYNDTAEGTYGQLVPGRSRLAAVQGSEPVALIQLARNLRYRTNLGYANLTARPLHLNVELWAAVGSPLGSTTLVVPPFGHHQQAMAELSPTVNDAYAVVSASSSDAEYVCYASIVDNQTGDPSLIEPVTASSEPVYIAAAAHAGGSNYTNWRTDLEICNLAAEPAAIGLELLPGWQDNSSPMAMASTLDSGRCSRFDDVLMTSFGFAGSAALRVVPTSGEVMVSSRTYNDLDGATYGQSIPGRSFSAALGDGQSRLIQLAHSADPEAGYRTNIGVASASAIPIFVDCEFFSGQGETLGSHTFMLEPYSYQQANDVFRAITQADLDDAFAVVSVKPGVNLEEAHYYAYASVVDNGTGDPVYIEAR